MSTETTTTPAHAVWAELTPERRNTLIGELLGATPLQTVWLVWEPKKEDGSVLGRKHLGQLGSMPMENAHEWLAAAKTSQAEWTRRGMEISYLLRDEVVLSEHRWHLRYSETPGGGWDVIEKLTRSGYTVQVQVSAKDCKVIAAGDQNFAERAPTMAEAACKVALRALSHPQP